MSGPIDTSLHFRRRTMIALGTSLVAFGCVPRGPEEPKALAARYVQLWRALLTALLDLPASGLTPVPERYEASIEAIVEHLSPSLADNLFLALEVFNRAAYVYGFHFTSFENLTGSKASTYCQQWFEGNGLQREVIGALSQIALTAYWRDEATWQVIGYSGPTSRAFEVASLGVTAMPVNETELDLQTDKSGGTHHE